jgi:protein-disulfide isomerase
VARDTHPQACLAAYAAECAGRTGHYWEMYDALFELFPMLAALGAQPTLKQIGDLARRIGVPIVDFHMCLKDKTVREDVVQSVMDGRALGIQGTPAVFANGVALPLGAGATIYLEWLIRDHLRTQGQTLGPPVTY